MSSFYKLICLLINNFIAEFKIPVSRKEGFVIFNLFLGKIAFLCLTFSSSHVMLPKPWVTYLIGYAWTPRSPSLCVENPWPTQDLCCCNLLADKLESQSSDLLSPWLGKGKLHLIKPVLKKGMLSNLYCSGALTPAGGLGHHKAHVSKSPVALPRTLTTLWLGVGCRHHFNKASCERTGVCSVA